MHEVAEGKLAGRHIEHSGRSPVEGLLHKLLQLRHSNDGKKESASKDGNDSTTSSADRRNAHLQASTSGHIPADKASYELKEVVGRGSTSQVGDPQLLHGPHRACQMWLPT